jgi:hypothetical protein
VIALKHDACAKPMLRFLFGFANIPPPPLLHTPLDNTMTCVLALWLWRPEL